MNIAIIPAYKPDGKLIALLRELKPHTDFAIIVVDDGSPDDDAEVFEKAKAYATVLRHSQNSGKGTAIKTALEYVGKNFPGDAVIVTLDADGQHKVEDAVRVCRAAARGGDRLVIGSRIFSGKVPWRSRAGNAITRFVFRFVTGLKVGDTQTGLRAFGAHMLPFMTGVRGSRYEYEMNVLLTCARKNVEVEEVPIETVYINDNASSHFNTVKDSYRIYKEIVKFCASSLIGFLVDMAVFSVMILLTRSLAVTVSVPLSNIVARVFSASANFLINKKFVFKNNDGLLKTAVKYFSLAAAILCMNTVLLTLLVTHVIGNEFVGKILVEVSMFIVSWLVQRFLIFKRSANKETVQ